MTSHREEEQAAVWAFGEDPATRKEAVSARRTRLPGFGEEG
jgi:hypothetical protein